MRKDNWSEKLSYYHENVYNIFKFHLDSLWFTLNDYTLERILISIGKAIEDSAMSIEEANLSNNEVYIDYVSNRESDVTENLVGIAFVVCQTYITSVVSEIIEFHKRFDKLNLRKEFSISGKLKKNIMSFGSKYVNGCKYTEVQLIDAFANYFKHKDEWPPTWRGFKYENNARLIESIGASKNSTGNLRKASEILGNPDYKNTNVFWNIVNGWGQKLYDEYCKDCKELKIKKDYKKDITNALVKSVNSLHKSFQESHQKRLDEKNQEKVWQGRASSLSSVFEMETAKNLSEVYPEYHFLVDYPISIYRGGKRLRTIYPDILVLKNFKPKKNDKCEVVAIIDLKIDLGWVDINDYKSKEFTKRENEIRNATHCRFKYIVNAISEEEKKSNKEIGKLIAKVPSKGKLKKIFIICSKMNHPERTKEFQSLLEKNGGYKVLFLLDKHLHPNTLEEKSREFKKHIQKKETVIKRIFRGL